MLTVSTAELPPVLVKYVDLAANGDISFTQNGVEVARLVSRKPKRDWIDKWAGIIPAQSDEDDRNAIAERLSEKYESHI